MSFYRRGRRAGHDSAEQEGPEPFGPERLDLSSPTGLKAEGLVAGCTRL
jgi:hypothetical protein